MNIENKTRNLVLAAVFMAIIIIMAAVMVLGRITKDRKDHKDGKE